MLIRHRKLHPLRRLLVVGLNEAIENGSVGFGDRMGAPAGFSRTEICGKDAVLMMDRIGREELRFTVWWDYQHDRNPNVDRKRGARESFRTAQPTAPRSRWPQFVGVTVSGWLERREGAWLQGRGRGGLFGIYVRSDMRAHLDAIPDPVPLGYAAEGRLFM